MAIDPSKKFLTLISLSAVQVYKKVENTTRLELKSSVTTEFW